MINKCEICNKNFFVKPSREKRCHARFCSWECFKTKLIKKCIQCGKEYKIQRWKEKISKYCSWECHWEAKELQVGYWTGKKRPTLKLTHFWKSGKDHPYWKGGISRLDKETRHSYEYVAWRKKVLERDGNKCVICGNTTNLQIDHIKSFRSFPELRFDIKNGRVLCAICHKKTDSYGFFPKKEGLYG